MDPGLKSKARMIGSVAGIFGCYFFFGIFQERIVRGNYDGERFQNVLSLVLILCLVNFAFASVVRKIAFASPNADDNDSTPTRLYAAAALSYLTAALSAQKAMTWVSYPAQVIGKSCKPIPVMFFCAAFCKVRYPVSKYGFVSMVVVGVVMFMYKDEKAEPEELESFSGIGEILLLVSLVFDGVGGAVQERLNSGHSPNSVTMMSEINKWSVLFLAVAVSGTQEPWQLSEFVYRHPAVIWHLLVLSVTGAVGQFFVYVCLSDVGPLQCSLITTTRKLVTVLASIIVFGNTVTVLQCFGAVLVFAGLFLDLYFGKKRFVNGQEKTEECNYKQFVIWCC